MIRDIIGVVAIFATLYILLFITPGSWPNRFGGWAFFCVFCLVVFVSDTLTFDASS